jgi:hypothetical protein
MVASADSAPSYSLPSQLRPVAIGNLARVDSVVAVFNDANGFISGERLAASCQRVAGSWHERLNSAYSMVDPDPVWQGLTIAA